MASPAGWAYTVGVNMLRRHHRRRTFERRLLRRSEPVELPDLKGEVWDMLQDLPPRQREALALRYVEDLSQESVAAKMRIAPGTAAATLSAARQSARPDHGDEL